jgi:hypothetical protein
LQIEKYSSINFIHFFFNSAFRVFTFSYLTTIIFHVVSCFKFIPWKVYNWRDQEILALKFVYISSIFCIINSSTDTCNTLYLQQNVGRILHMTSGVKQTNKYKQLQLLRANANSTWRKYDAFLNKLTNRGLFASNFQRRWRDKVNVQFRLCFNVEATNCDWINPSQTFWSQSYEIIQHLDLFTYWINIAVQEHSTNVG